MPELSTFVVLQLRADEYPGPLMPHPDVVFRAPVVQLTRTPI